MSMQSLELKEAPVFSPLLRRYTLQEFWDLPTPEDRYHYDLIGGYLFMVPPPAPPHGRLDSRLTRSLVGFLNTNRIEGEVHHPHEPIYRSEAGGTYLEPDMMFVSETLAKSMGPKRSSADIVFEYASKSTANYDRTTKADTYLALGVRELWLIDSSTSTIEVRQAVTHEGRLLWSTSRYAREEVAESQVLPGWRVSVTELFEGLTEE
jgi:Uma2 family endonuclease